MSKVALVMALLQMFAGARAEPEAPPPFFFVRVTIPRVPGTSYCNLDMDPQLLKKAVTVVVKGEIWVARNVFAPLLEELRARRTRIARR